MKKASDWDPAVILGVVALLVLASLALGSCQVDARHRVGFVGYYRDSRTDICFASGPTGDDGGAVYMVVVPCEKVPKSLLNEAIHD